MVMVFLFSLCLMLNFGSFMFMFVLEGFDY